MSRDFVFRHVDARGSQKRSCKKLLSVKYDPIKITLEHGSALVMKFPTNETWYHSLPVRKNVTNSRINLTFRLIKI